MNLPTIVWVEMASTVGLVAVGLARFRYLPRELRVLLNLFIGILVISILNFAMIRMEINNYWIIHVYTLFEYAAITFVLSFWHTHRRLRSVTRISIGLFALFWFAAKFFIEDLSTIDVFTASMSHLLIISNALYILYSLTGGSATGNYRRSRFLVLAGILIYYTGNLLWLVLVDLINEWPNMDDIILAWTLHWCINICANLVYAGGFICLARR